MQKQCRYLIIIMMITSVTSCGTYFNIKSIQGYKEEINEEGLKNYSTQQIMDSLDVRLTKIAAESGVVGFGVALINKKEVLFEKGYGVANIQLKIPFTEETIMPIASISKTLAGVSLMRAVELGKLDLDDPIDTYLDFDIRNPHHPNTPILIRHLATHTSTLKYTQWYEHSYVMSEKSPDYSLKYKGRARKEWKKRTDRYNANVDMPMDDFVKSIYTEGGKWYSKSNYLEAVPGTAFAYCNENAALAALVIESATGIGYKDFVKEQILEPLELEKSSWNLANYLVEEKGKLYEDENPIPDYQLITYPDGGFVTSLSEFTTYFHSILKGHYGASNIISAESYKTMTNPQYSEEEQGVGIFWEIDHGMMGHSGGDPGVNTFAFFDEKSSYGYILFFKYGFSRSMINTMIEVKRATAHLIVTE